MPLGPHLLIILLLRTFLHINLVSGKECDVCNGRYNRRPEADTICAIYKEGPRLSRVFCCTWIIPTRRVTLPYPLLIYLSPAPILELLAKTG